MCTFRMILISVICFFPLVLYGQSDNSLSNTSTSGYSKSLTGFIRGGLYTGIDYDDKDKPYVSSALSDLAVKLELDNGINFKAYADIRFRYGVELLEQVKTFDLREAYVRVYGKKWNFSTGQQIIKWGRADFTNPTSKLCPQNYILRSPDREDMDMGNILTSFNWYPSDFLNFEGVIIPFYRSSVLIIDPIPLPAGVTLTQIGSLLTGKEMFSYGLKTDIHLTGIDWSLSWFDGYDPMPGTALSSFDLDLSGPLPVSSTKLFVKPYKTKNLGLDFELSAGSAGIRGEAVWSVPYLLYKTSEYVPLPELKWVTGADWSAGSWRFILEYSGKYVTDFVPSEVDPVIGIEPDYTKLASMLSIPGFDVEEYVRMQVAAYNRLYNYQLKRSYHSAGVRVETDLAYGKFIPSLYSMYNFTSHDFLLMPEIRYKPVDGLTITTGAEFYSGCKGSLYDIIDGFMNSVYLALRVDF